MINGSYFLTRILSKTNKITPIVFLFIATTILWIESNHPWTHLPSVSLQQHQPCSLNHISACQISNRTFLFIVWGGAGFCSEMNQILLAFAYSVTTKRRFIIDSRSWNYGTFLDYFHFPSSNYHSYPNQTFLVEENHRNEMIDHLTTTRIGTQIRKFWLATRHLQSIPIKRQVAHYLWNLINNETSEFIAMHRTGNLSNYIGIHVRRGDKLHKEAREILLDKYIIAMERILQSNKTSSQVFVASDDDTVVDQFRQLKPKWSFFSLHDQNLQRKKSTGHFQNRFNRLTRNETLFETRLFMCELQMLVDAEYVVCAMSSNVCRLVQILRHQHPSTMISMDRPWYGT